MTNRRIMPALLVLVLSLSCALGRSFAAGEAPSIGVKSRVDRRAITIGGRIKYTLEVTAGKGTAVEFPKFADYRIGDFEIKDSGSRTDDLLFGRKRYKRWFYITTYATGAQTIPEVDIRFRGKAQKGWSVRKAPAIEIKVDSVLPKGASVSDIRGLKAPLAVRNPYYGIASLAAALAIFLAITVVAYRRMRHYVPVRLPHETALEELEAIRAAFLRSGDFKACYVEVSDCIRRYIEHAFGLKAPEMTTEEFLDSLRDSPTLTIEQKELLKGFMGACDMVKFAKYAPTRDEAGAVYETAKSFVDQTREVRADGRV